MMISWLVKDVNNTAVSEQMHFQYTYGSSSVHIEERLKILWLKLFNANFVVDRLYCLMDCHSLVMICCLPSLLLLQL